MYKSVNQNAYTFAHIWLLHELFDIVSKRNEYFIYTWLKSAWFLGFQSFTVLLGKKTSYINPQVLSITQPDLWKAQQHKSWYLIIKWWNKNTLRKLFQREL